MPPRGGWNSEVPGSILLIMSRQWAVHGGSSERQARGGAILLCLLSALFLSGSQPAPTSPTCTKSLQAQIVAAPAGSTLLAPPCIYRETVTITKPITLVGRPGSEILGSDVWSGWTRRGPYWIKGPLPTFSHDRWPCEPGSNDRCRWPEQVFLEGQPLLQVAAAPASGQFSVDSDRWILLADNPTGRRVEVTTRQYWVVGRTSDVTIRGFRMRYAANPAQQGALSNGGYANWTVESNVLSDAHGAVVSLDGAGGLQLLNNDISRGGEEGVHSTLATDLFIQGNRVHDNNTEQFDPGWEAGGLKLTGNVVPTINANEVYDNAGPGIWCDAGCSGATISNNRVHDNSRGGISYEISHDGRISGNAVWQNGGSQAAWGFGAGILCQNCDHTSIDQNTVAWNANGISVICQDRGDSRPVVGNSVRDNTVVESTGGSIALGWFEDWAGRLYDRGSDNRGSANSLWYPIPEGQDARFEWAGAITALAVFSATPGGSNSRYLTAAQESLALRHAIVPASPARATPSTGQGWLFHFVPRSPAPNAQGFR